MAIVQPLLSVRDVETSLAFYEQLGFVQVGAPLPGQDGKPVFVGMQLGPVTLSLDHTEYDDFPADAPRGVGIELYISLDESTDIDALYAKLSQAGVTILRGIEDEFWGDRRFIIQDPDGYRLTVAKNVRAVSHGEMTAHTQDGN